MVKVPCKHCSKLYKPSYVRRHETSCQSKRNRIDVALEAARQVRRRYELDALEDEGGFDAPAHMEVDFEAAVEGISGTTDHGAQPWAPNDALQAAPTLEQQHAAALEAYRAEPEQQAPSQPVGEMDALIEYFNQDLLNDVDEAHEFDSDDDLSASILGEDESHVSIHAYDYVDMTGADADEEAEGDVPGKTAEEDRFHPDNFDENLLPLHRRSVAEGVTLPTSMHAQLDLALLLKKAGTPLYLHDKIIDWVQHYTRKDPSMWTTSKFLHRKKLLEHLGKTYKTKDRQPSIIPVPLDDGEHPRKVDLPRFPFVLELLSLLHNNDVMKPSNIVEGYDIFTGLVDGDDFWVHDTIEEEDLLAVPTPKNPDRLIGEVLHGTKFQMARKRYCTEPHHMAVPLILFYDKASHDKTGALSTAPISCSCSGS